MSMIPFRFTSPFFRPAAVFNEDFLRPFFAGEQSIRVNISDDGDAYTLTADMPGADPKSIFIECEKGILTLGTRQEQEIKREKGNMIYHERRSGNAQRSFGIENVREDAISAKYDNGILTIHLPKVEPGDKPRKRSIPID